MGFVPQTKLSDKMIVAYQFAWCGHSNLVIFNHISSKFHIWISCIKLLLKLEYGICPTNDNQNGHQNGHRLMRLSVLHVVVTLT